VVGWVFVVFIGYHAVLAAVRAVRAGRDGNWSYAVELAAIAIVASLLVIAAVIGALRNHSRTARSRTP
jgi:hypothetical protein